MKILFLLIIVLVSLNNFVFAQIDSSFVIVNTKPGTGFLVIDNNYDNCIEFKNGDRIKVQSGLRALKVVSDSYRDISNTSHLEPEEEENLSFSPKFLSSFSARKKTSSYANCFWGANVIILSDDDASTSLNGTPLSNSSTRLTLDKSRQYQVNSTISSSSTKQTFEPSGELTVIENYLRPLEQDVLKRSFIPGYAQFTKHQKPKGYLLIGFISTFAASSVYSQARIISAKDDFNLLEKEYNNSMNPNEILKIISASNRELDTIDRFKKVRNTSILALLATYTFNVLDGRKEPKIGFRYFSFDPYVDFDKSMLPKANIKIDF